MSLEDIWRVDGKILVTTITYTVTNDYHIAKVGIGGTSVFPTFPMCDGTIPYDKQAHIDTAIRQMREDHNLCIVDNPTVKELKYGL